MNSNQSHLELCRASFRYPRASKPIIDALNLSFQDESTLLLGKNGAGKSTLLKLGAGMYRPTAGRVVKQGRVIYLPQKFVEIPGLSCREYVTHLAWLAGQSLTRATRDAEKWLDAVGLGEYIKAVNTQLSGGQQARLALAYALNAGADLVLLDEPGAALDPLSKRDLHSLYRIVRDSGASLVVSSHDPADIEGPFDRVVLLDTGKVRFDGTVDDFINRDHEDSLVASFAHAMQRQLRNVVDGPQTGGDA